jgi:hypothetical protein
VIHMTQNDNNTLQIKKQPKKKKEAPDPRPGPRQTLSQAHAKPTASKVFFFNLRHSCIFTHLSGGITVHF